MIYRRRTIAGDLQFEGLGLHSGVPVRLTLRPSSEGIVFRYGSGVWQASPSNVTDTTRSTKLGEIGTIEHLMSALAGLEITDVDIEASAPEMPALDGSAKAYVDALLPLGTTDLGEAEVERPFSRIFVQEGDTKLAIGAGEGHWRYVYGARNRWPEHMAYEISNVIDGYVSEIAPARTFGLEEEIPMLMQMGLAQGLNLETALVLGLDDYKNMALFPDEPARHKLLDAIGDLYLAGVPIRLLNVVAEKTGHASNVRAAQLLYEAVRH